MGDSRAGRVQAPRLALLTAAIGMAEKKTHRVVVIDANGRMPGVVTTFDIVKAVAAGLDFSIPPAGS